MRSHGGGEEQALQTESSASGSFLGGDPSGTGTPSQVELSIATISSGSQARLAELRAEIALVKEERKRRREERWGTRRRHRDGGAHRRNEAESQLAPAPLEVPYTATVDFPLHLCLHSYTAAPDGSLRPKVIGEPVSEIDLSPWRLPADLPQRIWSLCTSVACIRVHGRSDVEDGWLDAFSLLAAQLRTLELTHLDGVSPSGIFHILNSTTRLHRLNLRGTSVPSAWPPLTSLTDVDLSECPTVRENVLPALAGACPKLIKLSCAGCQGVTDAGLSCILLQCPSLQLLNISHCQGVMGSALLEQEGSRSVTSSVRTLGLRSLNLSGCGSLLPQAIEWVAAGCLGLQTVVLADLFELVSSAAVKQLALRCHSLESVSLRAGGGIDGLEKDTIPALIRSHRSSLRRVDLSYIKRGVQTSSIISILSSCTALEEIDISGLESMAPGSFQALRGPTEDPASHPSMTCLRIFTARDAPSFTDDDVISLCANAPGLLELCVSGARGITVCSLKSVVKSCPRLEVLELDTCSIGSREGDSEEVARTCAALTSTLISLSLCQPGGILSDFCLPHCGMPALERLCLEGHASITCTGWRIRSYPCLSRLSLDAQGVHDIGPILRAAPNLHWLRLGGLPPPPDIVASCDVLHLAGHPWVQPILHPAFGLEPIPHCDKYLACAQVARRKILESAAASEICRAWRLFMARKRARSRFACSKLLLRALVRLLKPFKEQKRLAESRAAAIVLQRCIRRFLSRRHNSGATALQALWRGWVTRQVIAEILTSYYAARCLQAVWRGYRCRHLLLIPELVAALASARRTYGAESFNGSAKEEHRACKELLNDIRSRLQEHRAGEARRVSAHNQTPSHVMIDVESPMDFDPVLSRGSKEIAAHSSEVEEREISRKTLELCIACSKRVASLRCDDCKVQFCLRCSLDRHKQADRLSHSVRPVVQLSGSGKRASATICQQPATLDKMMRTALSRAARLRAIHARGEERTRQNAFKRRMKESEEAKLQAEKRRRENQAIISHNDAQIAAAERMQRACRSYLDRKGNADESPWRGGGPALTSIQATTDHEPDSNGAATTVQALWRGWSVRHFMSSVGTDHKRAKPAAAQLVQREFTIRRIYDRSMAIEALRNLQDANNKAFDNDTTWLYALHESHESKWRHEKSEIGKALEAERRLIEMDSKASQGDADGVEGEENGSHDANRMKVKMDLAEIKVRLSHMATLHRITKQQCRWSKALLRQHYARRAARISFTEAANKLLSWLVEEDALLSKVEGFCMLKLDALPKEKLEYRFRRAWLEGQIDKGREQRKVLDMEQEFLLETETGRLQAGLNHAARMRAALEELLASYHLDGQLELERAGPSLQSIRHAEGSKERVTLMGWSMVPKDRQEHIRAKIQEPLEHILTEELKKEEMQLQTEVVFTGGTDGGDDAFKTIAAHLIEPQEAPRHLGLQAWKDLYFTQPWLAAQAEHTAHQRANRDSELRKIDEMRAVQVMSREQIASAQRKLEEMKKEKLLLNAQLSDQTPAPEGAERLHIMGRIDKLNEAIEMEEEMVKSRMDSYNIAMMEIGRLEAVIEKQIKEEDELEAKRCRMIAEFQLSETRGKAAAVVDSKEIKSATESLKHTIQRLQLLHDDLSGKTAADEDAAKRAGVKGMLRAALGRLPPEVKPVPLADMDAKAQMLEVERSSKLADINRQIKEAQAATETLRTSPTSAEATMIVLNLKVQAENAEATAAASDEAEKIAALNAELKSAKEELRRENERKAKEEAEALKAHREELERAAEKKRKADNLALAIQADELAFSAAPPSSVKESALQRIMPGPKKKPATKIFAGGFETEEAAMQAAIFKHQKAKLGMPEGISHLRLTVGNEEATEFAVEQHRIKASGLPYFRQVDKSLGARESMLIWARYTLDADEMITHILLGSGRKGHVHFKDLSSRGYEAVRHPALEGPEGRPNMVIWCKRDPHGLPVGSLEASYTTKDERHLSSLGFHKINPNLSNFDMGDVFLWFKQISRNTDVLLPTRHIEHQLNEVMEVLRENPSNSELKAKAKSLKSKLDQSRQKEEERQRDTENPLKYAVETFALTKADVDTLVAIFSEIDEERTGFVTADSFLGYLRWPQNQFTNHLFEFAEAADEDGNVDFGDFVRTICTYCLLGKQDLLTYAYTIFDSQGKGFISYSDLLALMNLLHKSNTGQISRALRELDRLRNAKITSADFVQLDKQFPKMFYPVSNMQQQMREAFLGVPFWTHKMDKFKEIRDHIASNPADDAAARRRVEFEKHKRQAQKAVKDGTLSVLKSVASARKKLESSLQHSKLLDKFLS